MDGASDVTRLELDHLRYLKNRVYRRRVRARLRRLIAEEKGRLSQMDVLHEADDRCCRREPWAVTYTSLLAELAADGERVVGVAAVAVGGEAR